MVVDRGNVQGLMVLPHYAFVVAWREQRWRRAAVALAIAAALKIYPVLLVMVLLAERKFKEAAYALGAALVVSIVLFDLYPGGFNAAMQGFVPALSGVTSPHPDRIIVSNYSSLGMVANFCAALFGIGSPQIAWLLAHPAVFGILYLVAVAAVVFTRALPFVIRLACALSVLCLAPPLTYGYTFAFVTIIIGELLRAERLGDSASSLPRPLAVALALAVVTTVVPWPFPLPTGTSVGTILVPAAWIGLTATALLSAYAPTLRPGRATAVQGA
jgi:hypothetical protein